MDGDSTALPRGHRIEDTEAADGVPSGAAYDDNAVPAPPRSSIWWSRIGRDAGVAVIVPFLVAAFFPSTASYVFAASGLVVFFLGRAAWREWRAGNPPSQARVRSEARRLLDRELARLQRVSYSELAQRVDQPKRTTEVVGRAGSRYYVDTLTAWDGQANGPVRVLVSIDSGRWDAFVPLTDSFIKTREGRG